ncbi:uncharacterized protein K444DRAFT_555040 [Hyaloscypha bicolor E]|uniref:Uncharacterized protein n=1 Tax=Hyaloscypha bicolor E TaxID=1095630 RepID=A0A2J6TN26_9HELO|nr:uncharacterized protein K444DRAFT_555040 [Hyaloscypha bicolor E]PMD64412.1 hypothetical protein K444DRAFT_555040 [Hyaloscypha bicolor E]
MPQRRLSSTYNLDCMLTEPFSSFTAEVGATTQPMDARKFCQINLDLHYPQGFQFSVLSTTFRGFVGLDKGVTATLSALYYFSGPNQNQVTTSTMFHGPEFEPYTAVSNVDFTSLVWSPCGANWPLNVQTAVAVVSDNATAHSGFIENDSADGNIKFVAGISGDAATQQLLKCAFADERLGVVTLVFELLFGFLICLHVVAVDERNPARCRFQQVFDSFVDQ